MTDLPTVWENVVRFDETDLHGHVFFGEFFTYADETFTELLRRIDYPYGRMHREGWTTNVVHADLDYHAPATLGDRVENRMRIESIGEHSLTASYEAHAAVGKLATGEVVHVAVEFGTGDTVEGDGGDDAGAIRVPDAFREAVAEFQDGTP